MACPVFITSTKADYKVINRFLLRLHDWHFKRDIGLLITVRNGLAIWPAEPDRHSNLQPTKPPVSATFENGWVGANISDVNTFMLDNAPDPPGSVHMILDDKGVDEGTVIVAERTYDDEAEERTREFNKMRVPWQEAGCVWMNLDIGNVGFEEYCDEERGGDEDGFWEYDVGGADIANEEDKVRRDEKIAEYERDGLV